MMRKRTKCQCDINGSSKQWCQRHQCYKNPIEIRQCQISIPNFVAWDNCQGAGQNEADCTPVPPDKDEEMPNLKASSLGNTRSYVNRNHAEAVEEAKSEPLLTTSKTGCSSCGKNKSIKPPSKTDNMSSLETPEQELNAPNLMTQGWSFAKAVGAYAKSGMKNTSEEDYAERMLICDTCEWRSGGRCMKCGCSIDRKAGWASSDCPIGKWPKASQ